MALSLLALEQLHKGKNLLAFSSGSDSSALFFLLREIGIEFDLAIVDYQTRAQSAKEIQYAKELATEYGKEIYIQRVKLPSSNFEANAKKARFSFFEEIIKEHNYTNLITAHHLNDLFEWFLMQLSKGAGVVELIGMEPVQKRTFYTIVRPLLLTPKKEILEYLNKNKIHYFIDESNKDTKYRRNYFRSLYSDQFLQEFARGVQKSMEYLLKDRALLLEKIKICNIDELYIAHSSKNLYETKRILDQMAKRVGYLLSSAQKEEMIRQKSGVVGGKIAYGINEKHIFMAPYLKTTIPKKIRELYRQMGIPKPLRGYIYLTGIDPQKVRNYMCEG